MNTAVLQWNFHWLTGGIGFTKSLSTSSIFWLDSGILIRIKIFFCLQLKALLFVSESGPFRAVHLKALREAEPCLDSKLWRQKISQRPKLSERISFEFLLWSDFCSVQTRPFRGLYGRLLRTVPEQLSSATVLCVNSSMEAYGGSNFSKWLKDPSASSKTFGGSWTSCVERRSNAGSASYTRCLLRLRFAQRVCQTLPGPGGGQTIEQNKWLSSSKVFIVFLFRVLNLLTNWKSNWESQTAGQWSKWFAGWPDWRWRCTKKNFSMKSAVNRWKFLI